MKNTTWPSSLVGILNSVTWGFFWIWQYTQSSDSTVSDFLNSVIDDQSIGTCNNSMDGVNEGFYHGMMLGLCAVLGNRYRVRSNRESGLGRFDIQLMPLVNGIPGFIFEFKHTNDAHVDLGSYAVVRRA